MNYEQRYKEALEAVKELQEANPCDDGIKKWIEDKFPELCESEDDRIRKGIIRNLEYLADRAEGFVKDELKERIAWLEKQGERDARYENLEELLDADTIYQMAMNDAMVEEAKTKAMNALSELEIGKLLGIEKQRQGSTWSEADDEELEIAINTLKDAGQYDSADWLITLKQRIGK